MAGRTWAVSVPGPRPRDLQASLAGRPGVVDAVIQGDHVRLVTETANAPQDLARLHD